MAKRSEDQQSSPARQRIRRSTSAPAKAPIGPMTAADQAVRNLIDEHRRSSKRAATTVERAGAQGQSPKRSQLSQQASDARPSARGPIDAWNATLDQIDALFVVKSFTRPSEPPSLKIRLKRNIPREEIERLGKKILDIKALKLWPTRSADLKAMRERMEATRVTCEVAFDQLTEAGPELLTEDDARSFGSYLGAFKNLSQSVSSLDSIFINSLSEGELERPKTRFDTVAQRAAEVAEEIKALQPKERAQILQLIIDRAEGTDANLRSSFAASTSDDKVSLPFPIIASKDVLPEQQRRRPAKQKWLKRDKTLRQTPVDFILAAFSDRLGRGFTQADLKAADKSLYNALHQWLQETDPKTGEPNRIPPIVDLPSLAEWNARRLTQLELCPQTIDEDEKVRLAKVRMGRAARAAAASHKQR